MSGLKATSGNYLQPGTEGPELPSSTSEKSLSAAPKADVHPNLLDFAQYASLTAAFQSGFKNFGNGKVQALTGGRIIGGLRATPALKSGVFLELGLGIGAAKIHGENSALLLDISLEPTVAFRIAKIANKLGHSLPVWLSLGLMAGVANVNSFDSNFKVGNQFDFPINQWGFQFGGRLGILFAYGFNLKLGFQDLILKTANPLNMNNSTTNHVLGMEVVAGVDFAKLTAAIIGRDVGRMGGRKHVSKALEKAMANTAEYDPQIVIDLLSNLRNLGLIQLVEDSKSTKINTPEVIKEELKKIRNGVIAAQTALEEMKEIAEQFKTTLKQITPQNREEFISKLGRITRLSGDVNALRSEVGLANEVVQSIGSTNEQSESNQAYDKISGLSDQATKLLTQISVDGVLTAVARVGSLSEDVQSFNDHINNSYAKRISAALWDANSKVYRYSTALKEVKEKFGTESLNAFRAEKDSLLKKSAAVRANIDSLKNKKLLNDENYNKLKSDIDEFDKKVTSALSWIESLDQLIGVTVEVRETYSKLSAEFRGKEIHEDPDAARYLEYVETFEALEKKLQATNGEVVQNAAVVGVSTKFSGAIERSAKFSIAAAKLWKVLGMDLYRIGTTLSEARKVAEKGTVASIADQYGKTLETYKKLLVIKAEFDRLISEEALSDKPESLENYRTNFSEVYGAAVQDARAILAKAYLVLDNTERSRYTRQQIKTAETAANSALQDPDNPPPLDVSEAAINAAVSARVEDAGRRAVADASKAHKAKVDADASGVAQEVRELVKKLEAGKSTVDSFAAKVNSLVQQKPVNLTQARHHETSVLSTKSSLEEVLRQLYAKGEKLQQIDNARFERDFGQAFKSLETYYKATKFEEFKKTRSVESKLLAGFVTQAANLVEKAKKENK